MELDAGLGPSITHSPVEVYKSMAWYEAYQAALFETNRKLIPAQIMRAVQLILVREHELFSSETSWPEKRALNSALQALRALRNCLGLKGP